MTISHEEEEEYQGKQYLTGYWIGGNGQTWQHRENRGD